MNALPLAAALAAATLIMAAGWRQPAWSGDLVHDCQALNRSHGRERITIANRIGREHYLTRNSLQVDTNDETAESSVVHYRWSDIQQLCGR